MPPITVETVVKAPLEKVWECWTKPEHITGWAFASDDWEAPAAENDVRVGGKFKTVMAAKDGSSKFDFTGTYTAVVEKSLIEYDMDEEEQHHPEPQLTTTPEGLTKYEMGSADRRHVRVKFAEVPEGIKVTETFDPETENTEELQRQGWQAILDNFKKYAEAHASE